MKKIIISIFIALAIPLFLIHDYQANQNTIGISDVEYQTNLNNAKRTLRLLENSLNNEYNKIYAGEYIDETGTLHLCFTNNNERRNILLNNSETKAIYELKRHSLLDLDQTYKTLSDSLVLLNATKIALSIQDNCIYVHCEEKYQETILDYLDSKITAFNKDIVKFKDNEVSSLSGTTILGGVETYRWVLLSKAKGTVGFNAYHVPTKQYGIVTNAHVAPVGKVMFDSKGKAIGTSQNQAYGYQVDGAFVPFDYNQNSTFTPSELIDFKTFTRAIKRTATFDEYIEGLRTIKMGNKTGLTYGVIKYKSVDTLLDGKQFYDILECTNNVKHGDSGGPVGYDEISGRYVLLGLTIAKNNIPNTYVSKIPYIEGALEIIPVTSETKKVLP
ncbi:S1 family peptidase [Acholeplasma sp. OttesenSCG-928-E16]|nr:S1 family peptidase [Acholeplasma sp. OttesenSCG-928-E16]